MKYTTVINNQCIPISQIPENSYDAFFELNVGFITDSSERHCVNYFGYPVSGNIKLICCIANDQSHDIHISSCLVKPTDILTSMSSKIFCFEKFEREIHENFGILFKGHPWLKPVRYGHDRADTLQTIANYPFYAIQSEELHEVGVGPIHAGVIEPGHFRFICNGEQILHLEIQLGYQHRGIESLFLRKKKLSERVQIAESIAGDNVVGHTLAFAAVWESLCGFRAPEELDFSRTIALELERIAIHTGDLSAACTDVAYQLGSAVFGRLRTPIINFLQEWCGNRLAKGLIRPGCNQYPFTSFLAFRLKEVLDAFEPDFDEVRRELFKMPSALSRFERTGTVTLADTLSIGSVGIAARASGLSRDIRSSHPHALFKGLKHAPIIKHHGDVYSRLQIRKQEVPQSINYLRELMHRIPECNNDKEPLGSPEPDSFAISLVEGWRGEICHCAVTDTQGELVMYKVKDPSFHNWMALAMAVRNNEISDFPICNKSFNLSYCGHDL
ncbi:MAG: NADH-quinone oxidoreductase subunit C [Bacteroidetes bacterium]|nr:NADH-quinone oxidoreductase subunit C [Bacteroidota bacterium]